MKKSTTADTAAPVFHGAREARARVHELLQLGGRAACGRVLGRRRLDGHHRFPQLEIRHVVQRERPAHSRADAAGLGPRDAQTLPPRPRPRRPWVSNSRMASRTVERLTPNWRARSVSEGSGIAGPERPVDDALLDQVRNLPIRGLIVQRLEQIAAGWAAERVAALIIDSPNSSRPMSILRISEVPAPISYSLASRSSRPVG